MTDKTKVSAPFSESSINTLHPISDSDLLAEIIEAMKPTEQLPCARIINGSRTKAKPRGEWEFYAWRKGENNPFDQFEHEVESFFNTALVEKGATTLHVPGTRDGKRVTGIWGIMLDDIGSEVTESILTESTGFLSPSVITETSPGNYQWLYIFREIERDLSHYARVMDKLRTLAKTKKWSDKGALTRFRNCRLAGSTNMKPERGNYCSFSVDMENRHSLDEFEDWLDKQLPKFEGKKRGETPKSTGSITLFDLLKKHDPLTQSFIQRYGGPNDQNYVDRTCLRDPNHRAMLNVKTGWVSCRHDGQSKCRQWHGENQETIYQAYETRYKVKIERPVKKGQGTNPKRVTEDEWLGAVDKLKWKFVRGENDGQHYKVENGKTPELITATTEDLIQVQIERVIGRSVTDREHRKWRNAMTAENPTYDPFLDWLNNLDKPDRETPDQESPDKESPDLETWAIENWGVKDTEFNRWLSAMFFVLPVFLALNPGAKGKDRVRIVPVIKGPAACGKSTFVEHLIPEDIRDLCFADGFDLSMDKDHMTRELRGMVIVDCTEMAGVDKANMEVLKFLTTANKLRLVPKYAEKHDHYPRTWMLVVTANLGQELPYDFDAALRFCVLEVPGQFSTEPGKWLDDNRATLFSQALKAVKSGKYNGQVPDELHEEHKQAIQANTTPTRPQQFKEWVEEILQGNVEQEKSFEGKLLNIPFNNLIPTLKNKEEVLSKDMQTLLDHFNEDNKGKPLTITGIAKTFKTTPPTWTISKENGVRKWTRG